MIYRQEQAQDLSKALADIRTRAKIVFTNGCFDLLHVGHVRYLKEARSLGDHLVVGINSDDSVRKLKGPTRPIQQQSDRLEILEALACVDDVILFNQETPIDIITLLNPDILVKGGDWEISQIVGGDYVLEQGGKVLSLNFIDGKSTTKIIEKSQS